MLDWIKFHKNQIMLFDILFNSVSKLYRFIYLRDIFGIIYEIVFLEVLVSQMCCSIAICMDDKVCYLKVRSWINFTFQTYIYFFSKLYQIDLLLSFFRHCNTCASSNTQLLNYRLWYFCFKVPYFSIKDYFFHELSSYSKSYTLK